MPQEKTSVLTRRKVLIGCPSAIGALALLVWSSEWSNYINNRIFKPFGIPTPERPKPKAIKSGERLEALAPNTVLFKYFGFLPRNNIYGSGFFISPNLILTAAHVAELFSRRRKTRIYHNPGLGKPSSWVVPKQVHVLKDWVNDGAHSGYDIGLIHVHSVHDKRPIEFSELDQQSCSKVVNNSGSLRCLAFWGSRITGLGSFETQYQSGGICMPVSFNSDRKGPVGGHDAPTFPKWSGSPILQDIEGDYKQLGVHVRGEENVNLYAQIGEELRLELNKLISGASTNPQIWRKLWGQIAINQT